MFLRLAALFCFVISSSHASDWIDLNFEDNYKLTKNIKLTISDEASIVISKDDKWQLLEVVPLPMINVELYKFDWLECRTDVTTQMEIIDPRDLKNDPSVGVQLDNCYLEVFVETKDLGTLSLFR